MGNEAQAQPVPIKTFHPQEALAITLADIRRLPPASRKHVRYFWIHDLREIAEWEQRLIGWSNHLSREVAIVRPTRVAPGVWRIDITDYGWTPEIWEKLYDVNEPFFSVAAVDVKIDVTKIAPVAPVQTYPSDNSARKIDTPNPDVYWWTGGTDKTGQSFRPGFFSRQLGRPIEYQPPAAPSTPKKESSDNKAKNNRFIGSWVNKLDVQSLQHETSSQIPLVRIDWWLHQTWDENDYTGKEPVSKAAGYYNWLGLVANKSKLADALALGDASFKGSEKVRKLFRGTVGESSVAINPRGFEAGITRTDGVAFLTHDYKSAVARSNPLVLLEKDAKPDGGEGFITLPNGLFAVWVQDAEEKLVGAVPTTIAGDKQSPNPEVNVDVGGDCFRCHVEGLRPIDDWTRQTYTAPYSLEGYSREDTKRLQAAYIYNDLPAFVKRGQDTYTVALKKLDPTLTPGKWSTLISAGLKRYRVDRKDFNETSLWLGCTPEHLKKALDADALKSANSNGTYRQDPLLSALNGRKPQPIRFDHLEERYALLQELLAGVRP